jgi:broad specificity phosphatase PhoE
LSSVYLIRHGQAGTRANYDDLSELGIEQARLVGQYLAGRGIPFKAMIAGGMRRQQQTAAAVWRAYREAGLAVPDIVSDPCWNEFDMSGVFSEFAPRLARDDAQFERDYQELLRKLAIAGAEEHRAWTDCDTQAMRAWMEARYECGVESWAAFRERVLGCLESFAAYGSGDTVAVFTSAMPIALWTGSTLGVTDGNFMRLAGVLYNTSVTTLRVRGDDAMLFTFNGVAHLDEARLRTFR